MIKIAYPPFLAVLFAFFPAMLCAQWHELPGPSAEGVNSFCEIAGSNGSELYAAMEDGVYRTTDHAKTWQFMGLRGNYVNKISQYVTSDAKILFACVLPNGPYGSTASLCRSEDSGRTWDTLFSSSSGIEVAQDGNDIVMGVLNYGKDSLAGIYRSSDTGKTWTHQALAPSWNGYLQDFTIRGNSIFCITTGNSYDTLWTMSSHGNQWQPTNCPSEDHPYAINFFGNDLFVLGTGRVDISTDNGNTWLNPPNVGLDSRRDNLYSFAVNGRTIVASGLSDVYCSTDGANTWKRIAGTGGYPRNTYFDKIDFIDNQFFSGAIPGALISSDGITWTYSSNGITCGVEQIASDGHSLFASTERGIFRSTNHGLSWIDPAGSHDLVDSDAMLMHSVSGRVYSTAENRSSNNAPGLWRWDDSQWNVLTDSIIYSLAADSTTLFAVTGTEIIRSKDKGVTWTVDNNGLVLNKDKVASVLAGNGAVFTFTDKGNVYFSNDEGDSWKLIAGKSSLEWPMSVAFASNKIYLKNDENNLFFSSDNGVTWDSVNMDHPGLLGPLTSGMMVGIEDSLYLLNGATIEQLTGLLPYPSWGFASDDSFAYLVGNLGHISAAPLASLPLAVTPSPSAPASLSLSIFPNPSNGAATVTFTLSKRENISLKLFDDCGVKVATYFEGIAGPGEVQVPVDATGVPAGSYIAVLTTREGTQVARVAFIPK